MTEKSFSDASKEQKASGERYSAWKKSNSVKRKPYKPFKEYGEIDNTSKRPDEPTLIGSFSAIILG